MIDVRRREASVCLIMLNTKQGSNLYHFNAFRMRRPVIAQHPDPEADALPLELPGPVLNEYFSTQA